MSGGILLNDWESLWYKIVEGDSSGTVNANYLVVPYNVNNTNILDDSWVKICSKVADPAGVQWANGDVTKK
jgi:hypothetical protein